jgi:hypothetical protein
LRKAYIFRVYLGLRVLKFSMADLNYFGVGAERHFFSYYFLVGSYYLISMSISHKGVILR